MTAEEWEPRSWAAWWEEDGAAAIEAREHAYRAFKDAADARGAARMALWLALDHHEFRAEEAVAQGWLARCESTPVLEFLGPLLPEHAVGEDGQELETLLTDAGLAPIESGYLEIPEEYPDLDTLLRAWLSIGPLRPAVRNAGEDAVREVLTKAFAPLRTSNGGYRVEDEYRYVIATRG